MSEKSNINEQAGINNKARVTILFISLAVIIVLIVALTILNSTKALEKVFYPKLNSSESATVELYKTAIDFIMNENKDKIADDKYISLYEGNLIDIDTNNPLNSNEKSAIEEHLKKYNNTVYFLGYEELQSEGDADENGNFLGSLITIYIQKTDDTTVVLNLAWHKNQEDVWMDKKVAFYENNAWEMDK